MKVQQGYVAALSALCAQLLEYVTYALAASFLYSLIAILGPL